MPGDVIKPTDDTKEAVDPAKAAAEQAKQAEKERREKIDAANKDFEDRCAAHCRKEYNKALEAKHFEIVAAAPTSEFVKKDETKNQDQASLSSGEKPLPNKPRETGYYDFNVNDKKSGKTAYFDAKNKSWTVCGKGSALDYENILKAISSDVDGASTFTISGTKNLRMIRDILQKGLDMKPIPMVGELQDPSLAALNWARGRPAISSHSKLAKQIDRLIMQSQVAHDQARAAVLKAAKIEAPKEPPPLPTPDTATGHEAPPVPPRDTWAHMGSDDKLTEQQIEKANDLAVEIAHLNETGPNSFEPETKQELTKILETFIDDSRKLAGSGDKAMEAADKKLLALKENHKLDGGDYEKFKGQLNEIKDAGPAKTSSIRPT